MNLLKPEIFPFQAKFNATEKYLRVGIVHFEPFINKRRIGNLVEIHGSLSQAAKAIEAITRHKLSIVSIDDISNGYKLANGTFVGMMGKFQRGVNVSFLYNPYPSHIDRWQELSLVIWSEPSYAYYILRQEIDIFIAPALLNEERFALVEPSTFSISTYTLLTWSPAKIINPFNFAASFSGAVWASVFATFFLLVLVSWIFDRFLTPWRKEPKLPLTFYLWELFTYFFPQCSKTQQAGWFKICQMSFWISFSLLLMNFLSGALTSSMTIKSEEDFVSKYVDVLRFPRVKIFAEAGSTLVQMFTDPKNQLYRDLKTRLSPVKGMFSRGKTVLRIVSETEAKRGVVVASPTLCKGLILRKKEISGKCPNVMISSESAGTLFGSLLMSRRLPRALRYLINKGVTTSTEASLHQQYMDWAMMGVDKCTRQLQDDANLEALSILDTQGSFVLWSIGIFVACLGFLIEKILERRDTSRGF